MQLTENHALLCSVFCRAVESKNVGPISYFKSAYQLPIFISNVFFSYIGCERKYTNDTQYILNVYVN